MKTAVVLVLLLQTVGRGIVLTLLVLLMGCSTPCENSSGVGVVIANSRQGVVVSLLVLLTGCNRPCENSSGVGVVIANSRQGGSDFDVGVVNVVQYTV